MRVAKPDAVRLHCFFCVCFIFFSLFLLFIFSNLLSAAVFSRKAEFIELIFQKRGIQLLRHFTWNHLLDIYAVLLSLYQLITRTIIMYAGINESIAISTLVDRNEFYSIIR